MSGETAYISTSDKTAREQQQPWGSRQGLPNLMGGGQLVDRARNSMGFISQAVNASGWIRVVVVVEEQIACPD